MENFSLSLHLNKLRQNKKKTFAFTLAEVLITLTIIGVIAALTIPNLIAWQEERATISALKKTYSTLSDAYVLAVQENGTPDNWGLVATSSPQGGENILNSIAPYMKILKNCGRNTGCIPVSSYTRLNGILYGDIESDSNWAKAQLQDGVFVMLYSAGADCKTRSWGSSPALNNICSDMVVDINGAKKPNQFGKDLFIFYLTTYGIVPTGSAQDTGGYRFNNTCKSTTYSGFGCAAWVIYNENMDYLHCNDLDWNGKRKCG